MHAYLFQCYLQWTHPKYGATLELQFLENISLFTDVILRMSICVYTNASKRGFYTKYFEYFMFRYFIEVNI